MSLPNPYSEQNFFGFFAVFIERFFAMLCGKLNVHDIVSDELQIFVLSGVAISSALVGTFLSLRKMTMLANALSHTILLGIIVAYLMLFYTTNVSLQPSAVTSLPTAVFFFASIITALLTTFVTQFLTHATKLYEEASTGLVFTSFFALGVILVTLFTRNSHIGTEIIMGNVDLLHPQDLIMPWLSTMCNLLLCTLFFRAFQITSFDPSFAFAIGISSSVFHYLLMMQVSLTLVGSFRSVGVLLSLAFIVGPVLLAQLLTKQLESLLTLSAAVGVIVSFVGVALSRHILTVWHVPLSTTGLVVCVLTACYIVVLSCVAGQKYFYIRKRNTARQEAP